jgi:hypothetical protein
MKRQVRTIMATFAGFLLISVSVLFNACNPDPCKDILCKNNGVCREGTCKCATGFEGPFCNTKMYEKFIGTWEGTMRCNGNIPDAFNMVIAPEAQANRISFYDIFDQNQEILATVNLNDITIEEQTINGRTYKGNGYLDGKYITVYFQYNDIGSSVVRTCVYNGTKFN